MKKRLISLLAMMLALCLLLSVTAAAEECGIGEPASVSRDVNGVRTTRVVNTAPAADDARTYVPDYSNSQSVEGFVYRMYSIVLGRRPDDAGFADWVGKLKSGAATAADILVGFFNSPEYLIRNKSYQEIITDAYRAMMNRAPDAGGMDYWYQRLYYGMTPNAILAGFVNSTEFTNLAAYYGLRPGTINLTNPRDQSFERTAFVVRMYWEVLDRDADVAGVEYWCTQLANRMTGVQVANGFIFSSESWNRHLTNGGFVTMLYQAIMGRDPDEAGYDNWTSQLNFTNTREHVMNGFLFSPEFAAMCARAGIVVGSPVAEPDGTAEWQANINWLNNMNTLRSDAGLYWYQTREDLWRDVALVRAREEYSQGGANEIRPNGRYWYTAFSDAGFDVSVPYAEISFGTPINTSDWIYYFYDYIYEDWDYDWVATGVCGNWVLTDFIADPYWW